MARWRAQATAAITFAEVFGRRCPKCGEYALPERLCPTENCDMNAAQPLDALTTRGVIQQ